MLALNPAPRMADPNLAGSDEEEVGAAPAPVPALIRPEEVEVGKGSAVEVQLGVEHEPRPAVLRLVHRAHLVEGGGLRVKG